MKQLGIDGHSLVGGTGLVATIAANGVNFWLSVGVGLATFTYMALRAAREWVKLKHDLKEIKKELDEDEQA